MDNLQGLAESLPETENASHSSVTAQTPYEYEKLTSLTSIRILNLLPSKDIGKDEQLHCTLEEVSLDTNPTFQALSYTWGENIFPCTLLCSSHILKITQNLHDALQHFRLPDKELRIWIDAICINQSDTEEKSHQIPLMEEIYRKASNVLIWLGTESEGSSEAMQYLTRIGRKFLTRGGPVLEPKVEQHCEEHGEENKALWEEVYGDAEMMKKTDVIWTRSWFSRRWIIQEVAFAKKATVYCGTEKIEWEVLAMAAEVLARLEGDGSQFINRRTSELRGASNRALQNMTKLERIRKQVWSSNRETSEKQMHACLEDARGFECRDDKDRVFALLGIFNYRRENPFSIEYGKSEAEVFEAFARYCIGESNNVDILSWAGISNHALCGDNLQLPSWVPDWRLPFGNPTDMLHGFAASTNFDTDIGLDESTSELTTSGKLVDRVIAVVPHIGEIEEEELADGSPKWTLLNPSYIGLWYQVLEMTLFQALTIIGKEKDEYFGGGGSIMAALGRTLIMDEKEVAFDYKRHPGNMLPENVPEDTPQPELPDEFTGFRNYIYLKIGDLTGQDRVMRRADMIMIDYELMEYFSRVVDRSQERTFYVTRKGYMGLGPKKLQTNDFICILAGSRVPHALRPQNEDFRSLNEPPMIEYEQAGLIEVGGISMPFVKRTHKEKFQLIGECYTQGLMLGEIWREDHAVVEDFVLI